MDQDLSDTAQLISQLTVEIDILVAQIEPITARLKQLKDQRNALKVKIQPVMKIANVQRMQTPTMNIAYRPTVYRVPPFNKNVVFDAASEFFKKHNINITPDAFMGFIEDYRKSNKKQSEGVSFRKNSEYVQPTVPTVQPHKVSNIQQAQVPEPEIKPYEI